MKDDDWSEVEAIGNLEDEVRFINRVLRDKRWPSGLKTTEDELDILRRHRDAAAMRLGTLRIQMTRGL